VERHHSLVPGFHYYQLIIDGVSMSDPASHAFYGTGKDASGIGAFSGTMNGLSTARSIPPQTSMACSRMERR
jgi:hypothetical protein